MTTPNRIERADKIRAERLALVLAVVAYLNDPEPKKRQLHWLNALHEPSRVLAEIGG